MWLIYLYVIGCLVSWYLAAGMFFAEEQGSFPIIADKRRREQLGFAVALGFLSSLFWPLTLPMAWCLTGFAQHGVWRVKRKRTGSDS